jgi:hypothetical protein
MAPGLYLFILKSLFIVWGLILKKEKKREREKGAI